MCVYKAITATILQVTLWRGRGAAALKCNGGCALEEGARYINVRGSVQCGGAYTGKQIFYTYD